MPDTAPIDMNYSWETFVQDTYQAVVRRWQRREATETELVIVIVWECATCISAHGLDFYWGVCAVDLSGASYPNVLRRIGANELAEIVDRIDHLLMQDTPAITFERELQSLEKEYHRCESSSNISQRMYAFIQAHRSEFPAQFAVENPNYPCVAPLIVNQISMQRGELRRR